MFVLSSSVSAYFLSVRGQSRVRVQGGVVSAFQSLNLGIEVMLTATHFMLCCQREAFHRHPESFYDFKLFHSNFHSLYVVRQAIVNFWSVAEMCLICSLELIVWFTIACLLNMVAPLGVILGECSPVLLRYNYFQKGPDMPLDLKKSVSVQYFHFSSCSNSGTIAEKVPVALWTA